MSIAQDLIDSGLKKVGIISPKQSERNDGLAALNRLIASWSTNRLLIPDVTRESFALTIGNPYYTLSGRRIKIVDAYLRDGTMDYPLKIGVLKDYNDILDKTVQGLPRELYYIQGASGKILLDAKPNKAYVLFFDSWKALSNLSTLQTTVNLPAEYERALIFNLAVDMASDYDAKLGQDVYVIASNSMEFIKDANSTPLQESKLDVVIRTGGRSNILTDSYEE